MAGLLDGLFGNGSLFGRESASTSVLATGAPAGLGATNSTPDSGAIDMDAQLSKAAAKFTAKRASVPSPGAIDELVGIIKAVRNQYQIRSILEDSASYLVEGFRVKGAPGKSDDTTLFVLETDIEAKCWRIVLDLITIGWCVVYVSEMDKNGYPGITILHNCTVVRGVDGKAHIYLKLSDDAKEAIRNNPKMYPKYWQQTLDDSNGIDITRIYDKSGKLKQGGAYFVSLEPEGEDVYPVSPLYPVLGDAVDAERMGVVLGQLMDLVKFYWFQIRLGNDKGQDERDGRIRKVDMTRIQEVGRAFGLGLKSGAIITPGDVNAEHHAPETSPFLLPRAEREALKDVVQDQIGLPDFETASSDAAARMLAKSFLPKIDVLRGILLKKFVLPFLLDMGKRFPQVQGMYPILGDNALQELGTNIQKHRQLASTGAYSLQTLNEMLDPNYDFDREMARKEYEAKFKDTVGNLYEAGQGLAGDDPNAANQEEKPAGKSGDTKTDPKTQADPKSQPGRPSK